MRRLHGDVQKKNVGKQRTGFGDSQKDSKEPTNMELLLHAASPVLNTARAEVRRETGSMDSDSYS